MSEISEYPLVTFALFSYNQERYIADAVEAAFAQDYPNLEIILSDDCSTDKTFDLMGKLVSEYSGPHKVSLRRNSENVGIARHINLVFSLAAGSFVVIAAGDDVSVPTRVTKLVDRWIRVGCGKVSIFSAMDKIDASGVVDRGVYESRLAWGRLRPLDMLVRNLGVFGASQACEKSLLCDFPNLMARVVNEDHVIPFRASLLDGIFYLPDSLVKYRSGLGVASNYGRDKKIRDRIAPEILLRPYLVTVQKSIDIIHSGKFDLIPLARSRRADYLFRYRLSRGRKITLRSAVYYFRRGRLLFTCRSIFFWFASRLGL